MKLKNIYKIFKNSQKNKSNEYKMKNNFKIMQINQLVLKGQYYKMLKISKKNLKKNKKS